MNYFYKTMKSPVGLLKLIAGERGLAAILWENDAPARVKVQTACEDTAHAVLGETEKQLGEYFAGRRIDFSLPLDMHGTEFQKSVWQALLTIPFAETRSYGELARQIGQPTASRAVGAANGKNPLSIVVPCHRVIGSSGKLTGFAGGLDVKEFLLKLEGR